MLNHLAVGLGEIVISRYPDDVLVGYGLGSCLGIGLHDPQTKVTGLLHAILPTPPNGNGVADCSGKYVDRGICNLLDQMILYGADPKGLIVRMAGGANMLVAPGFSQAMNIGSRNVEIAIATLAGMKLRIASQEVGGHIGRTVRFYVMDGRMMIRTAGNQEREI
jgi:chemotaxis protein CheD